jgi:thioredoxin-related protein
MNLLTILISTTLFMSNTQIDWIPFWEAEYYYKQAVWEKRNHKKTIIFLHDANNAWSKRMIDDVFKDSEFSGFINERYNSVFWEIGTYSEDIIYEDILYMYKPAENSHQFSVFLTEGKSTFPCIVVLDENFKIERRIKGYMPQRLLKEKLMVNF